jgi:hypothetical protein
MLGDGRGWESHESNASGEGMLPPGRSKLLDFAAILPSATIRFVARRCKGVNGGFYRSAQIARRTFSMPTIWKASTACTLTLRVSKEGAGISDTRLWLLGNMVRGEKLPPDITG